MIDVKNLQKRFGDLVVLDERKYLAVGDGVHVADDHQSGIRERPSNAAMFKGSSQLIRFLGSNDSYIETGNDNE